MLFPVTTVVSWPRPPKVAEAMRAYRHRRIDRTERDRVVDEAVIELLRLQETLGCDIVTDGELQRDNFYSFVADKLSGVRLMTLAEMLEVVEDKAGFEQLLQTLDVPAYSISSPICTARIDRREPLTVDDLAFARRHTDLPIKVTLPGPYLLTRAMFVPELTREYYADKEALAQHVVALLRAELEELRSAGADFVQFDEPVLTEVAFAPGRTRTFMCAALAARRDPAEELEFALSLINEVVAGIDDLRLGVHVCRGNWSRGARSARTSVRTADSARFRRFLETCQSSVRLSRVPAAHPTRAISQPIQPRLLGTTSTHEPKTSNAPTRYNSQLIRSVVTASVQAS